MLEFICNIPDAIGWTMVGILGVANLIMFHLLGSTFVQMWKDWHEEEAEEYA